MRPSLTFTLPLLLCAALLSAGEGTTVARPDLGFQITFPAGFYVESTTSKELVFAQARDSVGGGVPNGVCAYVQVSDLKEGESLRSFFTNPKTQDLLRGFTLAGIDMIKVDGKPAIKLVLTFSANFARGLNLDTTIYYLVAGRRGYLIATGFSQSALDAYAKEFEALVKSFKVIEAK